MAARVVPYGDARWNPNESRGMLVSAADGDVELRVAAHPDDPDRSDVRLVWRHAVGSRFASVNDEGLWAHPLYAFGLDRLLWLGVVEGSDWTVGGRLDTRRPQHFVAALKECVIEVLAVEVEVRRGT